MNVYKKRSLISILTMVLVVGLLSTALAVTTDGSLRRHGRDGNGQQNKGHSGEGHNRRAGINNYNGNVSSNSRGKQARTGRGKTTPVKIPASTSVAVAPTGNSENTDANHPLNEKGTDVSQLKGHSNDHAQSVITSVKSPASTSVTVASTGNSENTDANHPLDEKGTDASQLKGHSDDHAQSGITSVKIPASTSVAVASTGNSENTDADHPLNEKGTDVSQLKGHSDEGNNQRAYINNLNIDKNNNNRDNHARGETSPVKIPTSTSDTATPTES
ncbi:MAG: hypothetical protein GY777_10265 [Candidatus Brocadiaceae bacterium]|nr:hypothetical protein [Candidatus Brocadiaceae bacterium]